MSSKTLTPRTQVPKEQTWNAESVFADHDAWKTEFATLKNDFSQLDGFAGTLGQSGARLADWLELADTVNRRAFKLYFYASMSTAVDNNDTPAKALQGQIGGLYSELISLIAFAEPEIIALGEEKIMGFIAQEPRLAVYKHWAEDLFRQQQHVLSAEVEVVLGMMEEPFRSVEEIFSELANTDLKFPNATSTQGDPFVVSQSTINTALDSTDRQVRQTAWNNYADSYLAFKNTFAQTYLTSVKQAVMKARVRKYENVLESKLAVNNLPSSVFHNLVSTFKANIKTWHRFWDVKRRILKVDQLRPYDIWAPMTNNPPHVSYTQAVDWISEGMKPLGDDYVNALRQGCLQDRWVDRSVNEGKRQGAFSFGTYDTYPFIMMSFDDSLGAMSTLAHELGHSMHSYYTRKTQAPINSNYSLFVAEVASNFNQAMTRAYLFETHTDRDFQLALIQEAIDNFHRYFFIMPTLARFEYEVYSMAEQGAPLTVDTLLELMSSLYAEGYGDTMTDDPVRTSITWAQFGHLYEPYYPFQYATGISAAHALSTDIRAGNETARQNYLEFLSIGGAQYPLDALKVAGVDMSTPTAVEKTYDVLSSIVDRLETFV